MVEAIDAAAAPDIAQIMAKIDSIELTMVKQSLMDEKDGKGWCQEYAAHVEKRYRRYLAMVCTTPNAAVSPTRDIDAFWHQHILYTREYAGDCERLFGKFFHHSPSRSVPGEEEAKERWSTFKATKLMYARLFGEDYCVEFDCRDGSRCHERSGK